MHAQSGDRPTSGIEFRDRDLAIGGDLSEGSTLRVVLGERLRDDGSQGADAGFRAVEWYGDPDTADRVGDPSHKTGAWRQEKRRLPITRPRRNKNSQHLLIRDFHLLPCKICTLCPGKTFFNSNLYRLIESLIYLESIVSLLPSF